MLWWHKSASFTSLGISFGPPRKLGLGNEVLQYTWLTHRENYDISQCLKYHSKCLIFGAKIQIGDTNKSLWNFLGIFYGKPTIFFVIFWGTWGCFSWKIWVCNDMKKRGMSPKGNFRKDSLTILLSLWCRMISTPNSGKGTEFFLSTRSEFNSAKMQSTECMEGAEEIQGPDLVTLRLELVTFSFSYSSVISSISSSICE